MLDTLLGLVVFRKRDLFLTVADKWYFLTAHNCPDQTGRNHLEARENKIYKASVLVSALWSIPMLPCFVLHTNVSYPVCEKQKLSTTLQTENCSITQPTVLAGYGYFSTWDVAGVVSTDCGIISISSQQAMIYNMLWHLHTGQAFLIVDKLWPVEIIRNLIGM